jgi:drug/metabolite transporter (DMT)-like permease
MNRGDPLSARSRSDRRLWFVFAALAGIWGSSFLFIKIGVDAGLPPFSLVTWRLAIASLALLVMARALHAVIPRERRTLGKIVLLGIINVAIPFSLITWGETAIPSALASILNGLVPLFTIAFAAGLLPDEPITANRLTGLLVGFGGMALVLSHGLQTGTAPSPGTSPGPAPLLGELAVVVAAVFYAASSVFVRLKLSARDLVNDPVTGPRALNPVEIALPQVATAAAVVAILAVVVEWRPAGHVIAPPTTSAWFAVAWLGVLGSGVAYLLFFRLITNWGATRTTLVTYAMPIVGIALGVVVLGETIDLGVIVGTVLIIGGIALVNARVGGRRLAGRAPAPLPVEAVNVPADGGDS